MLPAAAAVASLLAEEAIPEAVVVGSEAAPAAFDYTTAATIGAGAAQLGYDIYDMFNPAENLSKSAGAGDSNKRFAEYELPGHSRMAPSMRSSGARLVNAAIQMAQGATEGSVPNGQTKRVIQQNTSKKKRRIEVATPNRVGNNTYRQRIGLPTVIGSELLVHSGVNELQPLAMKLGKNMRASDSVKNMLAHMDGSGSVSTEFSGWLDCLPTKRNTTFMCFRHNLGHDENNIIENGPYLPGTFILDPIAGNNVGLPGGVLPAQIDQANPYHHHGNMDTWFSPLNISDYEDMSWNLNKLKLGQGSPNVPAPIAQPVGLIGMEKDAPLYEANSHRQASNLWQNNNLTATNPAAMGQSSAPYKYNMVFNSGEVNYNFMNKGDGPLQATIIVYKVKKNNQTSPWLKSWSSSGGGAPSPPGPGYGVARLLLPPITQGFINSTKDKFGTDNIEGNKLREEACLDDPCYAFLPITRHVKQGVLPYKEEQRISFAINSGGHRNVSVKLGGDIYDPVSPMLYQNPDEDPGEWNLPKRYVLTEHSYVIAISVCGSNVTREYVSGVRPGRLGNMFSGANLQWDARYTEQISACSYKKPERQILYVAGLRGHPEAGTGLIAAETATTILPQTAGIRDSTSSTVPNSNFT